METDVVQSLGHLALATRLKRIAEQLQAGTAECFAKRGFTFQPGQVPLLAALRRRPDSSVGDLVASLGVSQPAVSRSLAGLRRDGLVTLETGGDKRVRTVRLTRDGHNLLATLETQLFARVGHAAAALCAGLDGSFLDQLAAIDRRLRKESFAARIERVDAR